MTTSSDTSASSASPAANSGVRHTTAILVIILVSYFMILLDNSIIFTALPKISAAMRFSSAGLRSHLGRARENGLTETELKEMIIHLAFYAGWPRAMSAITLARGLSLAEASSDRHLD